MKSLLFILALTTLFGFRKPTATIPQETIDRVKALYAGQDENMVMDRLMKSTSAFQKWKGFPLYYFDFMNRSQALLPGDFFEFKGLCAGNPHLENFGFVFLGKPVFSLNDLEHSGTCALNSDTMRLYIGHKFLTQISAEEWLTEYKAGLAGLLKAYPLYLKNMENVSRSRKIGMPMAYRTLLSAKECNGDYVGLTGYEEKQLRGFIEGEGKTYHKACRKTGGTKRYIVFYKITNGFEVIELKPLDNPAPLIRTMINPNDRVNMYKNSVVSFYGDSFVVAYQAVSIDGVLYQRRPLWDSHQVVKETELSQLDLKEVIKYQARTLGHFHSKNKDAKFNYSSADWEKWAQALEKKWKEEFAE